MYYLKKHMIIPAVLVLNIFQVQAYDLDEAIAIYQAEANQEVQILDQQAPEQRSREYYHQKWLEQQGQTQPASHDSYGQQQYAQSAPEADDLFLATVNGNTAQIGSLLSQGLNVNTANAEGETALHMAAARGHYSAVIYLVKNGADIHSRTIKNWMPIHHAVRFRHANIANFLLQRGSSPHQKTSDGLSAIDMARNVNDYRLLSILGAR